MWAREREADEVTIAVVRCFPLGMSDDSHLSNELVCFFSIRLYQMFHCVSTNTFCRNVRSSQKGGRERERESCPGKILRSEDTRENG